MYVIKNQLIAKILKQLLRRAGNRHCPSVRLVDKAIVVVIVLPHIVASAVILDTGSEIHMYMYLYFIYMYIFI